MMLADRLKKSVQEILQLSTLEHELWLGYLLFEDQENKKTMTKAKQQPRASR
jgi:hypothetical protein